MESAASARAARWWLPGVLVVEVLLFLPALIAPGIIRPPLPKISEATDLFYPWHLFWRDEVLAGRLPFWNPFMFAGMPHIGEPQTQTFYPAHALSLLFPADTAFKLLFLLHIMLASWLMYRLVRELGGNRWGSALAGMVFGLQGQVTAFTAQGWMAHFAPMAWAPGVIWLLCRALRDSRRWPGRHIAGAGALLGIQIISGHPEWVRYTLFIAVLLVLLGKDFGRRLAQRLGIGAAIVAIGLMVGGVQLLPLVQATLHSGRGHDALASGATRTGAGLPLASLPTVIAPRVFGPWDASISADGLVHKMSGSLVSFCESLIYVGILPLGLACIGWRHGRRSGAHVWLVIAALGVLFALNDWTHLQSALDWIVPLDATFRSPARFVFLTTFSLSVLAGLGATMLEGATAPARRIARAAAALAMALAGVAAGVWLGGARIVEWAIGHLPVPSVVASDPRVSIDGGRALGLWAIDHAALALIWAAVLLIATARLLPWAARRLTPATCAVLLAFVALDLGVYAYPFVTSVVTPQAVYASDAELLRDAMADPAARVGGPTPRPFSSGGNATVALRVRSILGFDGFSLLEWERLSRVMHTATPDTFAAIGVTHYISGRGGDAARMERLPDARGHAWFSSRVIRAADADDAAARLPEQARHGVVLEADAALPMAAGTDRDAEAIVTIDRDVPGALTATVDAPGAGFLVVGEIAYPGWVARVNGASTPIHRAFGVFQAVPVPSGRSQVEMRFRPTIVAWGAACTASGLIVVIALASRRRGSRPPAGRP
jgi:hypothetical protein